MKGMTYTIRSAVRIALAIVALVSTAAVLTPDLMATAAVAIFGPDAAPVWGFYATHVLGIGTVGGMGLAGFRFPIKAYTRAQLEIMAGPVRATDLEAIPHVFFDTLAFASAATVNLNFYQALPATPDLGNIPAAGQLPDPSFFQPFYLGFDPLILPAIGVAATVVGPFDDLQRLVLTGRPTLTLNISGKPYILGIPLSFFHTSGGVTGGHAYGTSTTGTQSANNSVPDGGYCVNGSFIIPPKQAFNVAVAWPATVTLNATPVNLRQWMAGVYFRRVL